MEAVKLIIGLKKFRWTKAAWNFAGINWDIGISMETADWHFAVPTIKNIRSPEFAKKR
jgi:hypothetical protein